MKFKVAKRDLESALQVVGASLSSSGNDISTHLVFRRMDPPEGSDEYGIEVLTFSGRIFSSCPLIASVEEAGDKGAFTIEGKRLKQWLAHSGDGALTFTLDEGEVTAKASRGRQTFRSLDPSSFPYWDKTLEEAEVTATVEATRVSAALAYAKSFASDQESSHPQLCVCEVQKGILWSSDKKAITLVRLEEFADSKLRVHVKDTNGFLSFLNTFDGTKVEVLEHDRALIFRRGDGAVFGEARFQTAFPTHNVGMDDKDAHTWTLPKDEVNEAIGFLVSGAAWEDNRLRIKPSKADDEVILSMSSVTGKVTELTLNTVSTASADGEDVLEVPDTGFEIDYHCLNKVLSSWPDENVSFGINPMMTRKGLRGFVRFVREDGADKYLTIVAWLH